MPNDALTYLVSATAGAAQTTSTNYTAANVPNAGTPDRGFIYKLEVSAVSGTTPTLAGKIQVTRDGGTTWLDAATFKNPYSVTSDNITGNGEYFAYLHLPKILNTGAVYPQQIRFASTVGGTTPSFSFTVSQVLSNP